MSQAQVVLTGIAANDPTPGTYEEINFAVGPAAGSGTQQVVLLVGNFLPAGTGTAATVYGPDTATQCQTETDVINLTGAGSELHRMWLRFTRINKSSSLYILLVTQSVGTQAAINVTFLTPPTKTCTTRIYVEDDFVEYTALTNDALATTTAAIVLLINAKTQWGVTAAQATVTTSNDSVAITAKQRGPRGNFIYVQTTITPNAGMTVTLGARTALTGGATADSNTTALAAINTNEYYYIVSAAEDASQFGAVQTQVASMSLPITGIRQRCFAGAVDATISNVNTIATGLNGVRAEIIWQMGSDWTPAEVAAHNAALYSLLELPQKPRNNYSLFPTNPTDATSWQIPAPRSGVGPTSAQIRSALANGVTPIARLQNGQSQLVKRITTRSLSGSTNDYRIRDAHKVTICDKFARDAQAKTALQFGGKDLFDNPKQGQPQPDKQGVTPQIWGNAMKQLIDDYGTLGLLVNVDTIKANSVFQRSTANNNRLEARMPLQTVDIADQFLIAIDQVA